MQSLLILTLCVCSAFAVLHSKYESAELGSGSGELNGYNYNAPAQKQQQQHNSAEKTYPSGYRYHGPSHKYLPPAPPTTTAATSINNSEQPQSAHAQQYLPPTARPNGYQYRRPEPSSAEQQKYLPPAATNLNYAQIYLANKARPQNAPATSYQFQQTQAAQTSKPTNGYQYQQPQTNYLPPATTTASSFNYNEPQQPPSSFQTQQNGYQYQQPRGTTARPSSAVNNGFNHAQSDAPQYLPPTERPVNSVANDGYQYQQPAALHQSSTAGRGQQHQVGSSATSSENSQANGYRYPKPERPRQPQQNYLPPTPTPASSIGFNFEQPEIQNAEHYLPPTTRPTNAYHNQQTQNAKDTGYHYQPAQPADKYLPPAQSEANNYRPSNQQNAWQTQFNRPSGNTGTNMAIANNNNYQSQQQQNIGQFNRPTTDLASNGGNQFNSYFQQQHSAHEQRRPTGHATIERVPTLNSKGNANGFSGERESTATGGFGRFPSAASQQNAENNYNTQTGNANAVDKQKFANSDTNSYNNNFSGYNYNRPNSQNFGENNNFNKLTTSNLDDSNSAAKDFKKRPDSSQFSNNRFPADTTISTQNRGTGSQQNSPQHNEVESTQSSASVFQGHANFVQPAYSDTNSNTQNRIEGAMQSKRPLPSGTKSPTNTFTFESSSRQTQFPQPPPAASYGPPLNTQTEAISVPLTANGFSQANLWPPSTTILQQVQSDSFELSPYYTMETTASFNGPQQQSEFEQVTLQDAKMPPSQTLFNLEAPRQPHAVYGSPVGTPQSVLQQQATARPGTQYLPPSRDFQPPYYY